MSALIGIGLFLLGFVGGALFGVRNVGRVEMAKEDISEFLDEIAKKAAEKTTLDDKLKAEHIELKAKLDKLRKRLEGLGF